MGEGSLSGPCAAFVLLLGVRTASCSSQPSTIEGHIVALAKDEAFRSAGSIDVTDRLCTRVTEAKLAESVRAPAAPFDKSPFFAQELNISGQRTFLYHHPMTMVSGLDVFIVYTDAGCRAQAVTVFI